MVTELLGEFVGTMENRTTPNTPVPTAIRMILRIVPPFEPRSTRVDSTPRSLSNGRRFWHENGEPAADYANYADADVRLTDSLQVCIRVIRVIRGWFPLPFG